MQAEKRKKLRKVTKENADQIVWELKTHFVLEAIQRYLGEPTPTLPPLASRHTIRMHVVRIREKFGIPQHVPFIQFRRFLKIKEGRLKCQLNKK